MDPARIYGDLEMSRARVLDAARVLSDAQFRRPFGFGLGSLASTLTHIAISEWYYVERMEGRDVPPYSEWPVQYERPPEFAALEQMWRTQAPRTRACLAGERDWSRRIEWISRRNEAGKRYHVTTTAADMATQLMLHEVHHRAQALAMLRQMGDGAPIVEDIDFNSMMYTLRPVVS